MVKTKTMLQTGRNNMKKYLLGAVAAAGLMVDSVAAHAEPVPIQLKWVTQAQFAGYFVAQANGF